MLRPVTTKTEEAGMSETNDAKQPVEGEDGPDVIEVVTESVDEQRRRHCGRPRR